MSLRKIFLIFFLILFGGFLSNSHSESFKMKISYPSVSGIGAQPVWVAKDANLFEKYGLNATLLFIEGGRLSTQALVGGDIEVALADAVSHMWATLQGMDIVFIGSYFNDLSYRFAAKRGITRLEQLRGKKIGVDRFGGRSDLLARVLLKKSGLDPEKDLVMLQIGGSATRIAALSSGSIDAAPLTVSQEIRAKKMGLSVIDIPPFPFFNASIATPRSLLYKKEDTYRAFMKGYIEGIKYFLQNRQGSVKIMARYMRTNDPDVVEYTYDFITPKTQKKPYPPIESIQNVIDMMIMENIKAKELKPEKLLDLKILKELDESGFIDALYK